MEDVEKLNGAEPLLVEPEECSLVDQPMDSLPASPQIRKRSVAIESDPCLDSGIPAFDWHSLP